MKKIGVVLILCAFLFGCSGESVEIQKGMDLRTKMLQADSCSFDVEITADYGDKIHSFSMECQADHDGNVDFRVTAPESIRDISGTIRESEGTINFETLVLQFDKLADDQITPVSAPWILIKTLRSGYLTSACTEDGFIRMTIHDSYEEDALQLDIWLNQENLPSRAEIVYAGRRIVSMDIKNVVIL